jgi:hypothetical protein
VSSIVSRRLHRPSRTTPVQCQRWPHREGWPNSTEIRFPGGVRGPVWRGFAFSPGRPRRARAFNVLVGAVGAASRACAGLERGGESPEGALGPRARRRIARGGVSPSSKHRALEQGGESPEGALVPRARRKITRGGTSPSREVENRPRGITAGRLVGHYGFFGPWAFLLCAVTTWTVFCRVQGAFICIYYFLGKGFFPSY